MQLKNITAEIFVPDNTPVEKALQRTTHLAIGAHQDDIEIMAYDGILKCFNNEKNWFTAVVVTNGSGSPRDGIYAKYTDEEMQKVRRKEQKKAAFVGEYSAVVFLDYPSSTLKDKSNSSPKEDIKTVLSITKPQVVYTHNLADKHETHVATVIRTIQALRELPEEIKPQNLYGCEVWCDLDWLPDKYKVAFDVSQHENLSAALLGIFDSQICGGKRYDLATIGRRRANATYFATHGVDVATAIIYALDLTALIKDTKISIEEYIAGYIEKFKTEVVERIKKIL